MDSIHASHKTAPTQARGIAVASVDHWFTVPAGKEYRRIKVLDDVNLEAEPNSFVAIVGPSGCGKTTLLNLLSGLLPQQTGSVFLDGKPPRAGRSDVAYMLARPALLPWLTALANVKLGMNLRHTPTDVQARVADDLLESVQLTGFGSAYPSQLSQGMRQRVALARTFATDSRFLLMDEPFASLDALTKVVLEDILLRLWESRRGSSVLFITHDLAEAIALADRVLIMARRPGRFIADVTIPLARPRVVADLQADPRYLQLYGELWSLLRQAAGG